ncbi:MAG: helix-turn-helix domain-containing protein [Rhodobacteraceae bacterium]|nr:helix-turn-helix domain-containing protein [Paracoccaceae bacterium]
MSNIPSYQEHAVPNALEGLVTRFLALNFEQAEKVTVPARPTGHIYLGWVPRGNGVASAQGVDFPLEPGCCHLSGQLTTFDAEYSIEGPFQHFLAECTPIGASRLMKRDMGPLVNRCEFFTTELKGPATLETFTEILMGFAKEAGPGDDMVEAAAAKIEASRGDLRIADLAAELCVSERHLRREFTSRVGIAPKAFATIKKVLATLQALGADPSADLAELAYSSGFYDQAHLTKVFQLYMRATPGKLRFDDDGVLQSIVAGA